MKNILKIFVLLLTTLSVNAQVDTQFDPQNLVVGVHAGYSITGSLVKNIANSDLVGDSNITASSIPALQLTADYSLSKVFSIGVAISHQRVNINATNYSFADNEGAARTESFSTSFRRTQFAIRPLIHYGKREDIDMYSGFRVGILNRGFTDFKGDNVEDLDGAIFNLSTALLRGNKVSLGLTAFGMRYYFVENIAAGFEVNIGAPYIFNVGISAKL